MTGSGGSSAGTGDVAGAGGAGAGDASGAGGATGAGAEVRPARQGPAVSPGTGGAVGTAGSGGAVGAGGTTGTGGVGSGTCGSGSAASGDVTVTLSSQQQKISGFGASTAWGSTMPTADADQLWNWTDVTNGSAVGAGLSLHRIRIAQNGTTTETNIAKLAIARGTTIWATPWQPNTSFLTQFGTDSGGNPELELNFADAQTWANSINSFITTMKNAGIPLLAVSAQNEPDNTCCDHFTTAQIVSWVGTYLGPTIANSGVKLMAPETQNWCAFPSYESAILADANASKYTSIIATHEYGCSVGA